MVTTTDGTTLTCIPHATSGVLAPRQWRWLLIDSSGTQYVGPSINDDPALGTLAERVSAWWDARKELQRHPRLTLV